MHSEKTKKSIFNNKLSRLFGLSTVLIAGLFLSGCITDPYSDDEYYGSGSYHGSSTQVDVYASSGSHYHRRNRSSYYDPYYVAYSAGYYYDPFYGVYYSYGSGAYGPYGHYRRGYGNYCPLHRGYYAHNHYRSHDHRSHHRNVRRHRDRNRNHRNRNDIIQPDTDAVLSNGQRGGVRNSDRDRRRQRTNSGSSLPQAGLDGVVPSRRDIRRPRGDTSNNGNRPRNQDSVARPRPNNVRPNIRPNVGHTPQPETSTAVSRRRQAQAAATAEGARRVVRQAEPEQTRRPRSTPRSEPRNEPRSQSRRESRSESRPQRRSQPRRSNRSNRRQPTQRH